MGGGGCLYCIGNNVYLVVLACESLHVRTVCIWRCEHARFCVDFLCAIYIKFHSFIDILIRIHSFINLDFCR